MKTIDDVIRELNGTWPPKQSSHICLACSDNTGKAHVFTREQFNRRAAEMGYWLEWEATETSECPVDPSVKVEVEYRDGIKESGYAREFSWDFCDCGTITRYRVVQPAKAEQLEVFWVDGWHEAELIGEYNGHRVFGFMGSMAALECDLQVRTRPSEREQWIEAARKASESRPEVEPYDAIYDAGLANMPGDV